MAKVMTVYLSNEELRDLERFCTQNNCSQYGALKMALKELLHQSVKEEKEVKEKDESGKSGSGTEERRPGTIKVSY
jgi:hypothetical protein